MVSVSEVMELSQPAQHRASPSDGLLPLTSSVGRAEGAPEFPAGKAQGSTAKFRTRWAARGKAGVGRGLGGEELSPSQALTSQDGVVEWGGLHPSLEGQAAVTNPLS